MTQTKIQAELLLLAIAIALVDQYKDDVRPGSAHSAPLQVFRPATMPYLPDEPTGPGTLAIAYRPAIAFVSAARATDIIFKPNGTL